MTALLKSFRNLQTVAANSESTVEDESEAMALAIHTFTTIAVDIDPVSLNRVVVAAWNCLDNHLPHPVDRDGLEGIEHNSSLDWRLYGVCCGVWKAALESGTGRLSSGIGSPHFRR